MMKIEIGKRYWRRDGGISAVITAFKNPRFPYEAGNTIYTSDGFINDGQECTADLVAEYTGPELKTPLMFRIGRRYMTKGGWVTPPVRKIATNGLMEFDDHTHLSGVQIEREYLGKDDPINQE